MGHTGILQDAFSLLNIVVSAVPIDWCCTWDSQWHFKRFDCTGFEQYHECAQPEFKQTLLCFVSNLCYRLDQNCTIVCHPGWSDSVEVTVEPQWLSTDAKITYSPRNKASRLEFTFFLKGTIIWDLKKSLQTHLELDHTRYRASWISIQ